MSESEKLRREEFQKNRKKVIRIFLAVILGLSILTVTFFSIFIAMDANTYVYFQEEGNVIYHAYLNDNEYYEEERLNGGHAYVSSLIQKMDAAFTYRVQMDTDDVTFRYQYRVDAQLMLLDRNSGAPNHVLLRRPQSTVADENTVIRTSQLFTSGERAPPAVFIQPKSVAARNMAPYAPSPTSMAKNSEK